MQRLTVRATTRRGGDAERAADYVAQILVDAGGEIHSKRGVVVKRGGRVVVIVDAADAVAVMRAARTKLDADVNPYALDTFNEMQMGAFRSSEGGQIGFANESYRVTRETL